MNFICPACKSQRTLPTLSWETIEDPQISKVECLLCGHIWSPPRIKRTFTKSKELSRKEEKRIEKDLYHEDESK